MPDLICAHHKCRGVFAPKWKVQRFCCTKCRHEERNWRKATGERVMNAAIDGRCYTHLVDAGVDEWRKISIANRRAIV